MSLQQLEQLFERAADFWHYIRLGPCVFRDPYTVREIVKDKTEQEKIRIYTETLMIYAARLIHPVPYGQPYSSMKNMRDEIEKTCREFGNL